MYEAKSVGTGQLGLERPRRHDSVQPQQIGLAIAYFRRIYWPHEGDADHKSPIVRSSEPVRSAAIMAIYRAVGWWRVLVF